MPFEQMLRVPNAPRQNDNKTEIIPTMPLEQMPLVQMSFNYFSTHQHYYFFENKHLNYNSTYF